MDLRLIVAIGRDGSIGKNGQLIWKISEDLKRFKALTTGHPVIMGRKTWESLPKKPLPGRHNIVLSHKNDFNPEGAEKISSVEEALELVKDDMAFVIGGEQIYKAFLPYVSRLELTQIDESCEDADAFLKFNLNDGWKEIESSPVNTTPENVSYRYVTYLRDKE